MMKIAKILLPVDFSEQGAGAAHHAGALARHFGAELTLLHVNSISPSGGGLPAELGGPIDLGWVTALEAQRYKELGSYRTDEFHGVNLKRIVVTGDPARCIVERAQRDKTDLIVMPTHGYGGFRRSLFGSVTAKILHDAECPVWTGAHLEGSEPAGRKQTANIICAIDNSPVSEHVLQWASHFAGEFRAQLTVVHAVPKIEPPDGFLDAETSQRRIDTAASTVNCFRTKTAACGAVVVEEGDPAKVVAKAARQYGASVVVIGRTPAAMGKGRLRPHAYSIIRDSPCAVISV